MFADRARIHVAGGNLTRSPGPLMLDIMVTGDTHVERIDYREGVLQINSGSPTLPHAVS